ncbi:MAG: family 10 glycosylhydrolase [Gemmatimonadaceae bacterium]|nr:family 10 glycosylhydrolase [Gemmatimonadaceae bacterium]
MPREFRAAWVATVANIDWPSAPGLPVAQQQDELRALLDRARAMGLNAIIFQVRPAADALYRSSLEPWSEYLTGQQGRAPSPMWDPLAFAVDEAHARGLELHAWFNPYRARFERPIGPTSATHISRTRPALVKRYGRSLWMDPGERAVRERTVAVVLDVVRRYDIDGVHLDDYFYPYPVERRRGQELPFPDDASWRRYRQGGGTLSRGDWRRDNVNRLVQELYDGVRRTKPHVKFGISPFGIWRPGHPASVRGFDAYEKLYADARKWLREGWVDYFTPQLYWPIGASGQSYPTLLRWWADENARNRHLWAGNFTSRVTRSGRGWSPTELLEQLRVTRRDPGAGGNVHFSMKTLLENVGGLADSLATDVYAERALVPASPWLDPAVPATPSAMLVDDGGRRREQGGGDRRAAPAVEFTPGAGPAPWLWVVRVQGDAGWSTLVVPGRERRVLLSGTVGDSVLVSVVSRVGVEGAPALARRPR